MDDKWMQFPIKKTLAYAKSVSGEGMSGMQVT